MFQIRFNPASIQRAVEQMACRSFRGERERLLRWLAERQRQSAFERQRLECGVSQPVLPPETVIFLPLFQREFLLKSFSPASEHSSDFFQFFG